jgi:hypothetical protein
VDLVVISGNFKPDLDTMMHILTTDLIVLDSSVGIVAAGQWKMKCQKQGIPCWNVAEQGSYWKIIE